MHSSTSSSENLSGGLIAVPSSTDLNLRPSGTRIDRFTIILLATVVAMFIGAEAISGGWFDQTSRVHRRQWSQRQALLEVRDSTGSAVPHAAVLGNSLLLDAVDVHGLTVKLDGKVRPAPYFVLATLYYDWFYGLKRLFDEGMRPRYVVLGLSPNQFASRRTRGDYSAQYLFRGTDLLEISRLTGMDPTTTSGFFLSHYSHFYGTRAVTRGFVMARVLPGVAELMSDLATVRESAIPEATLRELAGSRLPVIDRLCRENGSRFILVVPPTYQPGADVIADVGRTHNVTVVVPVAYEALDASHYQQDGFHLSEKGARVFTAHLATALEAEVAKDARLQADR